MRKQLVAAIAACFTVSSVYAQDCDAVKAENKRLKAEIASLRYSNKGSFTGSGGNTNASNSNSGFAVQTQTDKSLNFKLVSAVGNKKNQTVAVTIVVTNKEANFDNYNTQVSEFISDKGETFNCESAMFGKAESRHGLTLFATLYTNVPLKTVYFFKGVLPSVAKIKLLPLPYFDKFGGQVGKVEFRDVAISWR